MDNLSIARRCNGWSGEGTHIFEKGQYIEKGQRVLKHPFNFTLRSHN
jgi:hypothetical protein